MGQNAHSDRTRNSLIKVDWLIVVIATVAIFLLVGTTVRRTVESQFGVNGPGYQSLGAEDHIVAFETFTFGAEGWTPSLSADDLPGLGPVLGPFRNEAVQRSFSIPAGATLARLRFDLNLLGDWSEGNTLRISIGELQIAQISLQDDGSLTVQSDPVDGVSLQTVHRTVTPARPQASLGGDPQPITIVRLHIGLAMPDATLTLRLQAEGEAGVENEAGGESEDAGDTMWAIDTLSMTTVLGEATR